MIEKVQDGDTVTYRCAVDIDCVKKCFYQQKQTFVAGNFKRHFQSYHPDVLKELALGNATEEEPVSKKPKQP